MHLVGMTVKPQMNEGEDRSPMTTPLAALGKSPDMKTIETKTAATSTATDSASTSAVFLDGDPSTPELRSNAQGMFVRASASDEFGAVEEDSTDVFLLTRCSPLNDF
jgi:hypothetical protein